MLSLTFQFSCHHAGTDPTTSIAKELRRNVVLVGKEDILLMNADSSEEGRSEEEIDDEEVKGTQCMEVLLYMQIYP